MRLRLCVALLAGLLAMQASAQQATDEPKYSCTKDRTVPASHLKAFEEAECYRASFKRAADYWQSVYGGIRVIDLPLRVSPEAPTFLTPADLGSMVERLPNAAHRAVYDAAIIDAAIAVRAGFLTLPEKTQAGLNRYPNTARAWRQRFEQTRDFWEAAEPSLGIDYLAVRRTYGVLSAMEKIKGTSPSIGRNEALTLLRHDQFVFKLPYYTADEMATCDLKNAKTWSPQQRSRCLDGAAQLGHVQKDVSNLFGDLVQVDALDYLITLLSLDKEHGASIYAFEQGELDRVLQKTLSRAGLGPGYEQFKWTIKPTDSPLVSFFHLNTTSYPDAGAATISVNRNLVRVALAYCFAAQRALPDLKPLLEHDYLRYPAVETDYVSAEQVEQLRRSNADAKPFLPLLKERRSRESKRSLDRLLPSFVRDFRQCSDRMFLFSLLHEIGHVAVPSGSSGKTEKDFDCFALAKLTTDERNDLGLFQKMLITAVRRGRAELWFKGAGAAEALRRRMDARCERDQSG